MNALREDQQALRERLRKLLDEIKERGLSGQDPQKQPGQQGQQGDDLDDAASAMGEAGDQLGQGNPDGAVDFGGPRGRGLTARGAKSGAGVATDDGRGPGIGRHAVEPHGAAGGGGPETDPLGRPLRGRDIDDLQVKIPGEIDVQRVRRISGGTAPPTLVRARARSSNSITSSGC